MSDHRRVRGRRNHPRPARRLGRSPPRVKPFEPIAIVGHACLLPGCFTPDDLWSAVAQSRVLLQPAPETHWRADRETFVRAIHRDGKAGPMRADVAGVVTADDKSLLLDGWNVEAGQLAPLDPVFKWTLHTAGQALRAAGLESQRTPNPRAGLIMGNLSYPTRGFARLFEQEALKALGVSTKPGQPLDRFMSGLPAILTARALGFGGPAFALDAACASSIYALKLACDRLQDGSCDVMLAGAVNASDPLFIHAGFSAVRALSQTGQSRPFHREADGLVPSEGAAFFVLKRLSDAKASGDKIIGVIRGIGLGNDGRAGGFLSPSSAGQVRAMRQAFAGAGDLNPDDVSLIECHATGTAAGDHVEIESLRAVYGARDDLTLTALKANLGHSITTSAGAGLIKLLASFQHATLPPTPNARPLLPDITAAGYRVLEQPEAWAAKGPRTAALSAFGMGGNNAHLLLQEWTPSAKGAAPRPASQRPTEPVALVGLAVRTHTASDIAAFAEEVLLGKGATSAIPPENATVELDPTRIFSPPNDLRHALGQQLLVLETAEAALRSVKTFDPARTGVFVGMGADPEVNRHSLRMRLESLVGAAASPEWLARARDAIIEPMHPADIVGTMPNIPANRLNHCHSLLGPGFTVSAEEASGEVALDAAISALRNGELDTALVGAVDLSRETCHEQALRGAARPAHAAADAAVVFVLKRLAEAKRAGDAILAAITTEITSEDSRRIAPGVVASRFGSAHAASGLLELAAATIAVRQAAIVENGSARPALHGRGDLSSTVSAESFGHPVNPLRTVVRRAALDTKSAISARWLKLPRIHCFSAGDRAGLAEALAAGVEGAAGDMRLSFVTTSPREEKELRDAALRWLRGGDETKLPPRIHFQTTPMGGELAFAFTGAAAAYPAMGRELLLGMPELLDGLGPLLRDAGEVATWIYEEGCPRRSDPYFQLAGASFLSQIHARLTQRVFGLRPQAALGLSSGETNAMFALGIWDNMDGLLADIRASGLYTRHLATEFQTVREHWNERAPVQWENWIVAASPESLRRAIGNDTRVYLTLVNSPSNCVIAGDRTACRRVLGQLDGVAAAPLGHDLAVHCAVVQPFERTWREIHTRATQPRDDVRIYSNYLGGAYQPTREAVAEALTGQALVTVDFPKIIERAWQDGVRIFVEHGPRNHLSGAIGEILAGRPHLAVSLDIAGRSSLVHAADAAAALWAAGVAVNLAIWNDGARESASETRRAAQRLEFPLRKPPLVLPPLVAPAVVRVLPRPPVLVATDDPALSVWSTPVATTFDASEAGQPSEPALLSLHRELARVHQNYLAQQQAAHTALLNYQQRLHALIAEDVLLEDTTRAVAVAQPAAAAPRSLDIHPSSNGRNSWEVKPPLTPRGPKWSRSELETLASGKISEVFGPRFEKQDEYAVQVRMPEPPLLLCDRVTGIEGEPGSMGQGIVWTETDVRPDSWYLHNGRMPAGIFIEAGQADLLLISWLGADFLNRGERAYRLLGCELIFHGELPKPGETLRYQIHVDGHVRQGDVRLFFFHYDCWIDGKVRISVRHGQAGFFSPSELKNSSGVIWSPKDAPYSVDAQTELGPRWTERKEFTEEQVAAFAEGDLAQCFGAGFESTHYHSRTPRIQRGEQNLIGAVVALDPRGGAAGRGYLRAARAFKPDDWFFEGHFKNDPCMPGTLMAEGCLQAMAFYLAAGGYTLERDGWRFEPSPETKYKFVCRGQATPASRELVYELFVDSLAVIDGEPTLVAHVLCTVDGLKAFCCERLSLRLVRDYPLSTLRPAKSTTVDPRPVAKIGDLSLDYDSLLACAYGDPVDAFGPSFEPFRATGRSPRLPSPPYHFCTRVAEIEGVAGSMRAGGRVVMLYDIPPDAWYFEENTQRTMPLCVLLEVALQPCGWLASYFLDPKNASWRPSYRNLDGESQQSREITPQDRTIATEVRMTSLSKAGEQIIVRFELACKVGDVVVFACKTSFGFFTPASLADTKGYVPSAEELRLFQQPPTRSEELANTRDVYRERYAFELPGPRLQRLDRVAGIWPKAGRAGLGYARGEKDIRTTDWVFKAHFFQDPVQPGSIGVESILLLLKLFALETETRSDGATPHFEIAAGEPTEWHYRGQVLPHHALASADLEILKRTEHPDGVTLVADGRLWVDGKKIYHLPKFPVRLRWIQKARASELRAAVENGPTDPAVASAPLNRWEDGQRRALNIEQVRELYATKVGDRGVVLQDVLLGATRQFVEAWVLEDPAGYATLREQPVLYLANHQVAVESMLFLALADAVNAVPCRAIAKQEHGASWMGALDRLIASELGRQSLLFFDRAKHADLLALLREFIGASGKPLTSLLAHVHGTRAVQAGEPVSQLSSVLLDVALRCEMPIVPVRFTGGLPLEPVAKRLEFPVGFGAQHYHLGQPIFPETLAPMNLRERKEFVCAAINRLGPGAAVETPCVPDAAFGKRVEAISVAAKLAPLAATLLACLERLPDRRPESSALLEFLAGRECAPERQAAFKSLLATLRSAT